MNFLFCFFVFGGPKQLPCLDPQKTSFVSSEFFLTQPPPITWSWLGVFTIVSKGHFWWQELGVQPLWICMKHNFFTRSNHLRLVASTFHDWTSFTWFVGLASGFLMRRTSRIHFWVSLLAATQPTIYVSSAAQLPLKINVTIPALLRNPPPKNCKNSCSSFTWYPPEV